MLSRLALKNAQALPAVVRGSQTMSTLLPGFERKSRPIDPAPVRHAFVPEPWFQMFYPKTGVTGPYMFFGGVATFLLSKEIYIIEHEFATGCSILIMGIFVSKKFGKQIAAYADKGMDEEEKEIKDSRQIEIDSYKNGIEALKNEQARAGVQELIVDVKKENILLQLEAAYRERLATVGAEVKKRLEYQLQISHVERRLAQKHMAQWIINNVMKAITPDQEKASLQQCIKDLNAIAPRA